MSTTTLDPIIASAVAKANERTAAKALRREALATQQREVRDARKAAQAQADADRLKQIQEAARIQREAEDKERFVRTMHNMVKRMMQDFADYATKNEWEADAIIAGANYINELMCRTDRQLPDINAGVARVVQRKFTYGIFFNRDHIPSDDYFVGQRQEWFRPLYDEIAKKYPAPTPKVEPVEKRQVEPGLTYTIREAVV